VVGPILRIVVTRQTKRRYGKPGSGIAVADDVGVSEGQRKVKGERDQRNPRTLPDVVPNPTH